MFYATRRGGGQLRSVDIYRGLQQTVCAGDVETLVSLLHEQTRMAVSS
ncbi:hypothetical protein ACWEPC_13150 [Nonomuraea sp. NPDC004297]